MFIVQSLACYDMPTYVVEQVVEEYNVEVDRSHVRRYDPTKSAGSRLGQKYKDIFEKTREAFLNDIDKIPIASKSFRLRSLQRSYDFFVSKKNFIAANQVLEQAAKEVGDAYTNKLRLGDSNGNPLLEAMRSFNGGSAPIITDVEGEFTEVEEEKPKKSSVKKPVKKIEWKDK